MSYYSVGMVSEDTTFPTKHDLPCFGQRGSEPKLRKKNNLLPPTMMMPTEDLLYSVRMTPELRRADMYNRARREEMDAMLYSINPRHNVSTSRRIRSGRSTVGFASLFHGLRRGIGNVLITAGNRMQNPA